MRVRASPAEGLDVFVHLSPASTVIDCLVTMRLSSAREEQRHARDVVADAASP